MAWRWCYDPTSTPSHSRPPRHEAVQRRVDVAWPQLRRYVAGERPRRPPRAREADGAEERVDLARREAPRGADGQIAQSQRAEPHAVERCHLEAGARREPADLSVPALRDGDLERCRGRGAPQDRDVGRGGADSLAPVRTNRRETTRHAVPPNEDAERHVRSVMSSSGSDSDASAASPAAPAGTPATSST